MGGFRSSYFFIPSGLFITRMTRYYFALLSINLPSVNLSINLHMNIEHCTTALPSLFIITCKFSLCFFNLVLNTLFFGNFSSCYLFVHIFFAVEKKVSLVHHTSECHLALSHFL